MLLNVKDQKKKAWKKTIIRERAAEEDVFLLETEMPEQNKRKWREEASLPSLHCVVLRHKELLECIEFIEWAAEMKCIEATTISAFHGLLIDMPPPLLYL